jgi:hypothetical protein
LKLFKVAFSLKVLKVVPGVAAVEQTIKATYPARLTVRVRSVKMMWICVRDEQMADDAVT